MTVSGNTAFQRNMANYDSAWSLGEYTREPGLRPIEQEMVREFFPAAPAKVLDIGCGAGRTTVGLAELGYDLVAIDLAEPLLEEARRRFPRLDFRLMDATKLEFPDASFDAAIFSYNGLDCIYPLQGRLQCLREVFRVLKPGGVYLMSSHNYIGSIFSGGYFYPRGYWNAAKELAKQWNNPLFFRWYVKYVDGGGPQYLYSAPPSRTVEQLGDAGFEVLDVRGATGERRPGVVARRQKHVQFAARKPANAAPAFSLETK